MNTFFDILASQAVRVPFNPNWQDNSKLYSQGVKGKHALKLKFGEMVTSTDITKRRLVIIGTNTEKNINIVIFESYSGPNLYIAANWNTEAYDEKMSVMIFSYFSETTLVDFCKNLVNSNEFIKDNSNEKLREVLEQFVTT